MSRNEIGNRLRQVRNDLNLSQEEFAERFGISQRTYTRYERGETEVPSEFLRKISELGDYDMNWLLTGKGQMHFQEAGIEVDPDYAEFAANEAGDPGLQALLSDGNRKKYGITDDEAKTLKSVLFRRKGKGTLEQWLRILWSIRELE